MTRLLPRAATLLLAALIWAALVAAPASAACLAATVTVSPTGGPGTTVGSSCVVNTPYPVELDVSHEQNLPRGGSVAVRVAVPIP